MGCHQQLICEEGIVTRLFSETLITLELKMESTGGGRRWVFKDPDIELIAFTKLPNVIC